MLKFAKGATATPTGATDYKFFDTDYENYSFVRFNISNTAVYEVTFSGGICTIERNIRAELPSTIKVP